MKKPECLASAMGRLLPDNADLTSDVPYVWEVAHRLVDGAYDLASRRGWSDQLDRLRFDWSESRRLEGHTRLEDVCRVKLVVRHADVPMQTLMMQREICEIEFVSRRYQDGQRT